MSILKIGDKVVMNDKYYDKRKGEIFTIKAGPEMIGRTECFWLEDYEGAYCADGLDLYKPQTNEEWFCQLTTEEKAKFLRQIYRDGRDDYVGEWYEQTEKDFEEWLKQPHGGES